MAEVYHYQVPVNDDIHTFELSGDIVHVDCKRSDTVEFWALHGVTEPTQRHFYVAGTGHEIPSGWTRHIGTVLSPAQQGIGLLMGERGALVWHLFEGEDW